MSDSRYKRSNALHLTDEGRRLVAEMMQITADHDVQLFQELSSGERAELFRLVVKVRAANSAIRARKNTIGGAVLINTGTPELDRMSGRVEGTYGRFDRIDMKGTVNIPIAPGVAALRLSAATLNRDGYATRLIDGETQGNRSAQVVRAKLRIQPEGSGLTIDIGGDYTRARENFAPLDLLAVATSPASPACPSW